MNRPSALMKAVPSQGVRSRRSWKQEHKAIDARLPPELQGRLGYTRLLEAVSLRISVSGVRGKSGLTKMTARALQDRGLSTYAKVTGTDPVSYKDEVKRPIERDPRNKTVLEETIWEVKRYWPMDAVILENQAITPYTNAAFNELYCRPNYLFITNIRRDHGGDLARDLPSMAKAFALSAPAKTTIVSGERNRKLAAIVEKKAKQRDCRFIDAAPKGRDVPGIESAYILDAMLRDWMGEGLTKREFRMHRTRLQRHFLLRPSAIGIPWFHGAEINDVDSTREVLNHLLRQNPGPVTLIAYTRRDRVDRTASFIPYLQDLLQEGVASRVVIAGCHAHRVARRLKGYGEVWVPQDDVSKIPRVLDALEREAKGEFIYTIMNAVPPWPKALAAALAGDEAVNEKRPDPTGVAAGARMPIERESRFVPGVTSYSVPSRHPVPVGPSPV